MGTETNIKTDYHMKISSPQLRYLEFIEQQLYCPRTAVKARHRYRCYAAMPRNKDACLTANRRQFHLSSMI